MSDFGDQNIQGTSTDAKPRGIAHTLDKLRALHEKGMLSDAELGAAAQAAINTQNTNSNFEDTQNTYNSNFEDTQNTFNTEFDNQAPIDQQRQLSSSIETLMKDFEIRQAHRPRFPQARPRFPRARTRAPRGAPTQFAGHPTGAAALATAARHFREDQAKNLRTKKEIEQWEEKNFPKKNKKNKKEELVE